MIGGLLNIVESEVPASTTSGALHNGLHIAADRISSLGIPVPQLEGKLLRPLFALAMVPEEHWADLDERFWCGALAIQMVHEASLIHDDVVDDAGERRGRPTVAAIHGTGPAVVLGDHYLTGAYRAAARTGSFEYLERFTEAVERTVAGEVMQGRACGGRMTIAEYDEAITGKSGELFGIAGFLGSATAGLEDADTRYDLGRSFGNLYQRIDDLLDYCGAAGTGKPPLQDYHQKKWSWILDLAGIESFGLDDGAVTEAIFAPRPAQPSAARRALEILHDRQRRIQRQARRVGVSQGALNELLQRCLEAAEQGVDLQDRIYRGRQTSGLESLTAHEPEAGDRGVGPELMAEREHRALEELNIRRLASDLGGREQWRAYFGEHARTFHLAARLFPPREAGLVAGLYAYCRFTDDLVDDPDGDPTEDELTRRLDVWRELSTAAWNGSQTGIPLLDTIMPEATARGVDRLYLDALLDGVGMDLRPRVYECWTDLERYTFGVASAVGGWMSQLFGIRDGELLERAHALGHAMQLTNIARDVGEDWRRGRLYLPIQLLNAHDLTCEDLETMINGEAPISASYRAAMREMVARADAYYEVAWPGIRVLPSFFRRPVAAAASAYRGIHREIRRNDFDNLNTRAHTSLARKIVLAGAGIVDSRRAS